MTADLQAQLAELRDCLSLRFPDWPEYRREEFAERIHGIYAPAVSAHVAQVREGLADDLTNELYADAYASEWERGWLKGMQRAIRIVRPSVGPREQGGGS